MRETQDKYAKTASYMNGKQVVMNFPYDHFGDIDQQKADKVNDEANRQTIEAEQK